MRKILLLILLSVTTMSWAQEDNYCGEHKYDGENKNEVRGFLMGGNNIISGNFVGINGTYVRHLTEFLDVQGDLNFQSGKKLYGGAVEGKYRLAIGKANLYATLRYMFNRYQAYELSEHNFNAGLSWEARFWDLRIGASKVIFQSFGSKEIEPIAFQFGVGVNILPREWKWNLGLFFRNYDEVYYENWNINWGLRWNARIHKQMRLFGELDIRPAGSMSQLASKYEWHTKIGLRYAF